MFLVACSIFDNCGQSEPQHSCVWEFYALYLKCKLPLGRNLMFTPFQQAWAGICPWQREKKKKAPLSCHSFNIPSPFPCVPVCRSVFAEPFLKLTITTTKHLPMTDVLREDFHTAAGFFDALTHIGQAPLGHEHWIIRSQRQKTPQNNRTQLCPVR